MFRRSPKTSLNRSNLIIIFRRIFLEWSHVVDISDQGNPTISNREPMMSLTMPGAIKFLDFQIFQRKVSSNLGP